MSEQTINISFPVQKGILNSLKKTKAEFTKEILFSTALLFYRKRKLSLGKAAELAGFTKASFIKKLQDEQEFIFDYNEQEIDSIFNDVARIK